MRHSIIAYLGGSINSFGGYIDIENNEIEDASIEFFRQKRCKTGTKMLI
jgi:hypothetical protein